MVEYIERDKVLRLLVTAHDREKVVKIPAADVVPTEELGKREREIKRLRAEVDRLHKENFWLTGHHEGKQDGTA